LAFTPDGRLLLAANTTSTFSLHVGEVRFWEVGQARERRDLRITTRGVTGFALSRNGDLLAVSEAGAGAKTHLYVMPVRLGPGVPSVGAARTPQPPAAAVRLTKDLEALWADMAGADAKKAYRAIWSLVAQPRQALALFRGHLRPIPGLTPDRRARLIADLGSRSFLARERATRELERLGELAEPGLLRALAEQRDLELHRRALRLLGRPRKPLSPGEDLRRVRAVETLELIGGAEVRKLLEDLAAGDPGARLTRESRAALQRLGSPK
jgi:hypothetical protein